MLTGRVPVRGHVPPRTARTALPVPTACPLGGLRGARVSTCRRAPGARRAPDSPASRPTGASERPSWPARLVLASAVVLLGLSVVRASGVAKDPRGSAPAGRPAAQVAAPARARPGAVPTLVARRSQGAQGFGLAPGSSGRRLPASDPGGAGPKAASSPLAKDAVGASTARSAPSGRVAPATEGPASSSVPQARASQGTSSAAVPGSGAGGVAGSDPEAAGNQALALVRYPWWRIPGYRIRFLPGGDAPAPGYEATTTFVPGQPGGESDVYVWPGESIRHLAGVIAFEIGHEVDAAALYEGDAHAEIEAIAGVHPQSWAPSCDCPEQGYMSGWYAAAFSDYWSPGVGDWATIAPEPTGATLERLLPYLDPPIPGAGGAPGGGEQKDG